MGWGPGTASNRDEPRNQPLPGERLGGMEDHSVVDMEPTKPFSKSTRSLPRAQEDQEGGNTPFLLTTQPRPRQKHERENSLMVRDLCSDSAELWASFFTPVSLSGI